MSKIKALMQQKAYSELTESERDWVLKTMDSDAYEAERHLILSVEKLKKNQAHLTPNPMLRAQLVAKMQTQSKQTRLSLLPYGVAASLLLCVGIGFFYQKMKINQDIIALKGKKDTSETDKVSNIVLPNTLPNTLPTPILDNKHPLSINTKKRPKKHKTTVTIADATDADIAATFNRKNPNFDWQTEEDEADNTPPRDLSCPEK